MALCGSLACTPAAPRPAAAVEMEQCEALRRAGPPATRRDEVVEVIHGQSVADPYRWLEDVGDPQVVAWMEAQDAYARASLQVRPGREALRRELLERLDITSTSVPGARGELLFFARRHRGQQQAKWMVQRGERGTPRTLLDPQQLDPAGRVSIRGLSASPDGRHVAYLVSRDGADQATLRVRDVQTGADLPDTIPGARYADASWAADGRSFVYTGLPDDSSISPPELPSHAEVRRHVLGTPVASDRVLYGPLGDAATFVGMRVADRGRTHVLALHRGWGHTDLYVRPADDDAPWQPLFVGHEATATVEVTQGRYFVHTNVGASRFRVVEIDPAQPEPQRWTEVVPEHPEHTLEATRVFGGRLLLLYMKRASSSLEIRELSGQLVHHVALPTSPASAGMLSGAAHRDAVYVSVSAMHRAPAILRLSMASGQVSTWDAAEVDVDEHLELHQVEVPSRDGTPVSMFVLHRDDLRRDGSAPTMLTGYGGFGVSLKPGFSGLAALWAERGGVWAVPNLRGGGEYGESWHEAGRRAHKQNTFDDFIAAAEYLHAQGYTRPSRLAIRGGSNGGLLVGAVSTQRPELFGAVVCAVPLLDMIRYHRFGSGPTWVDEYGSADDPEQFGWLWPYSPLHRVEPGVAYPPLLMLSADNDDRVDPMHARKFVAALQHAGPAPALLRLERGAGHGGSPRLDDRIEAEVDTLSFVLDALSR